MKEDLKRLLNEFLEETREDRREKIDLQLTNNMPKEFTEKIREPSLRELIWWLNEKPNTD